MRISKLRSQEYEYLRSCKHDMIDQHLLDCYNEIASGCKDSELNANIKTHKRLIHQLNMSGKNKYKTLLLLEQYRNSRDRVHGHALLMCTLNNRGLFSKVLSESERKNKH